jgi:hypothetical protein
MTTNEQLMAIALALLKFYERAAFSLIWYASTEQDQDERQLKQAVDDYEARIRSLAEGE